MATMTSNAISKEENERAVVWLHAVEDMELNDWEQGFVANCSDWVFKNNGRLSRKQYESLEKIYRKFF